MLDVLGFFVFVSLFFFLPTYASGWITGWRELRALYPAPKPETRMISNGSYRWLYVGMKWGRLGVALECYPEGLWLRPAFPANLVMWPVLVPWHDLQRTDHHMFGYARIALTVRGLKFKLRFSGQAAQAISCFVSDGTQ
ncbi:hypothetical protein [Massilia sp. CF038]|uniref:hypothetical protein n=1 Tax=Massilia sp. CF038 TaxID=1881045 RepID=UPI000913DB9A|nr:hypothetical protein [Massilia sp. CF038]SHH19355.1 hypothetical protein SAMN05428948_3248 [Massilia sp. CF038]